MKVWMYPPFGIGDPKEVEATPDALTKLMITGWSQGKAPTTRTPPATTTKIPTEATENNVND